MMANVPLCAFSVWLRLMLPESLASPRMKVSENNQLKFQKNIIMGSCRSEEHTSELQSQSNLVCRLLLEKKKKNNIIQSTHLNNTETHNKATNLLIKLFITTSLIPSTCNHLSNFYVRPSYS